MLLVNTWNHLFFNRYLLGNMAFHDGSLYEDLKGAVPRLVKLIETELDDRTRTNAAAALGNLVRHSSQLCGAILDAGAIQALVDLVDGELEDPAERCAGWTALFALGNFCSFVHLRDAVLKSKIQQVLEKAAKSTDPNIVRFGRRLCTKLE